MPVFVDEFVNSVLDRCGATRTRIGAAGGIWRAELPDTVARFLGRETGDLLYTFDPKRWEEGARLECLSSHSALVERLCDYASARGLAASAHIASPAVAGDYTAYIAGRFRLQVRGGRTVDESEWMSANLASGASVKLRGEPLSSHDLIEGPPPGVEQPDCARIEATLGVLADQWNRIAARRLKHLTDECERQFADEAAEIDAVRSGEERDRAMGRLRDRLQIVAECRLDMALLLWLPAR